jgi:hypothetical protein
LTPTKNEREQLYQLIVGMSDIGAAQATADYAAKVVRDIQSPLWFPLLEAVVVSYARPFTANRPFGRLHPRWATFDDPRQQELHDDLIEIRNRAVAHSDAAVRRVVVVPPGAQVSPLTRVAKTSNFAITTDRLPPSRFAEIERHCVELGTRMYREVSVAMKRFDDSSPFAFDLLTAERVEGDPGGNVTDVTPGE